MSGYLVGLVFKVGPVERVQRSVLGKLADASDEKNAYCWPSIQTIANETLYSRRAVIDAIQSLERDGWMKVHHRAIKGRWTAFSIDVDRLETLRYLQKEQEKKHKGSGAAISPEMYVAQLRQLHSQVKPLHSSSDDLDRERDHDSGELSALHQPKSQVQPAQSEVQPATLSGATGDTPNKEEKRIETSLKGESAPSPDDAFPEGLPVVQYVTGIFERHAVVAGFGTRDLAAQAIKAISRTDSTPLHLAAEEFDRRVAAAISRGETINNFWFTDDKWKPAGGPSNGTNQSHRGTGSAARVERAVSTWDRAITERNRARAVR